MMQVTATPPRPAAVIGWARLAIGFVQGMVLYGLQHAFEHKSWPATDRALFAGLAVAIAYAPLVLLGGSSSQNFVQVVSSAHPPRCRI